MIVCIGVKQQLRKICDGGGSILRYMKCFAGKARRRSMCMYCLSDNHTSQECHDNPANISWPWISHHEANTPQDTRFQGRMLPALEPPRFGPGRRGTCDLFNAVGGSRCAFNSTHANSCICALSAGVNTLERHARLAGVDQGEVVGAPSQNVQGWSSHGSTYPGRRLWRDKTSYIIIMICRYQEYSHSIIVT